MKEFKFDRKEVVVFRKLINKGVAEVASLTINAAATAAGNVTVTLDGVAYNVAVALNDTAIQVADKIRAAIYTGWTAGGTVGTATVTFTATSTGNKTDAIYSAGTTGAVGTMTTTTQGAISTGYIEERIKSEGTIEGIRVRFYPGQQKALTVRPIVLHKGMQTEDMLTYPQGGDQFLSGDDDNTFYDIVIPVSNDDEIRIYYENTSTQYNYTLAVDVVIDYYGGQNRIIGGVIQ